MNAYKGREAGAKNAHCVRKETEQCILVTSSIRLYVKLQSQQDVMGAWGRLAGVSGCDIWGAAVPLMLLACPPAPVTAPPPPRIPQHPPTNITYIKIKQTEGCGLAVAGL